MSGKTVLANHLRLVPCLTTYIIGSLQSMMLVLTIHKVFGLKLFLTGSWVCISQDFMAGKLWNLPGVRPSLNDWENHLGTIYTEVLT